MGRDVAEALGYTNGRDAISRHVDIDDKNTVVIPDRNKKGNPNQVIINESGLYSLILGSKLEKAKEFKHWVTAEVLPTIRKTGGYIKFYLTPPPLSHFSVKKNFLIKPSEYSEHRKNHYSWLEM